MLSYLLLSLLQHGEMFQTCSSWLTGKLINLTHRFPVWEILKTFQCHLRLNRNMKLLRILILTDFNTWYTRSVKQLLCAILINDNTTDACKPYKHWKLWPQNLPQILAGKCLSRAKISSLPPFIFFYSTLSHLDV